MTWFGNGCEQCGREEYGCYGVLWHIGIEAFWGFSISDKSEMETLSSPQVVSLPLPGCFLRASLAFTSRRLDMKSWSSLESYEKSDVTSLFGMSGFLRYISQKSLLWQQLICRSAPSTGRSFPWHPSEGFVRWGAPVSGRQWFRVGWVGFPAFERWLDYVRLLWTHKGGCFINKQNQQDNMLEHVWFVCYSLWTESYTRWDDYTSAALQLLGIPAHQCPSTIHISHHSALVRSSRGYQPHSGFPSHALWAANLGTFLGRIFGGFVGPINAWGESLETPFCFTSKV